jgi:hypothetical protein
MTGPLNKLDHLGRRMDRERMLREAWSWRDIGCHFPDEVEVPIGGICEQRDQYVLQCDDTDSQLH